MYAFLLHGRLDKNNMWLLMFVHYSNVISILCFSQRLSIADDSQRTVHGFRPSAPNVSDRTKIRLFLPPHPPINTMTPLLRRHEYPSWRALPLCTYSLWTRRRCVATIWSWVSTCCGTWRTADSSTCTEAPKWSAKTTRYQGGSKQNVTNSLPLENIPANWVPLTLFPTLLKMLATQYGLFLTHQF